MTHSISKSSAFDIPMESGCCTLLEELKILESTFMDKSKPFNDKIGVLLTAWQDISEFIAAQSSTNVCEEIFEFIYPHTINIFLHSSWLTIDQQIVIKFTGLFEKCLAPFAQFKSTSEINVKSLIELVKDPWGDPNLKNMINNYNNVPYEDAAEYFESENLFLISTRINILIQSKSEDLALQLLNAVVGFTKISTKSWIGVYIRVITNYINNIEYWRVKNDNDKLRNCERKLSHIFRLLTSALKGHIDISKETALTAFSLDPNRHCYALIKIFRLAISNRNFRQGRMDLKAIPPETGKAMVNYCMYRPFKVESSLLEACYVLGLDSTLSSDLLSIITSQRYKKLSWMHSWPKLRHYCQLYMRKGVAMRNRDKELKYLNIDYSLFKTQTNCSNFK